MQWEGRKERRRSLSLATMLQPKHNAYGIQLFVVHVYVAPSKLNCYECLRERERARKHVSWLLQTAENGRGRSIEPSSAAFWIPFSLSLRFPFFFSFMPATSTNKVNLLELCVRLWSFFCQRGGSMACVSGIRPTQSPSKGRLYTTIIHIYGLKGRMYKEKVRPKSSFINLLSPIIFPIAFFIPFACITLSHFSQFLSFLSSPDFTPSQHLRLPRVDNTLKVTSFEECVWHGELTGNSIRVWIIDYFQEEEKSYLRLFPSGILTRNIAGLSGVVVGKKAKFPAALQWNAFSVNRGAFFFLFSLRIPGGMRLPA